MVSLADRRRGAEHLEKTLAVSERRACQAVEIARSTKRRPSGRIEEAKLVARIHELSEQYPRFGYRKIFHRLRSAGWKVSRERVRLIRRQVGLRVPKRRPKQRRPGTSTIGIERAEFPNHVWSYDFVAKKVQDWIEERGIGAVFIDPGSPWQNGHNESFNGVFRDGCLNRWLFESLREARETAESWLCEYNEERPHGSLKGMTPAAFGSIWKEDQRDAA